jgi:hypothetical protein
VIKRILSIRQGSCQLRIVRCPSIGQCLRRSRLVRSGLRAGRISGGAGICQSALGSILLRSSAHIGCAE